MIDALYPGFTIECTRGPPRALPAPGASRHPPSPPYPGRRPSATTNLHPRSRHRPTSLSRLPSLSLLPCVFSRRGYPTLRYLRAIPRKCAMRGATDRQLARNSQDSMPPTRRERHGRPADGQMVTPFNSRRVYPRHNRPGARPTAIESRRDRRTQNTPDPAGARSARPRDRLKRAGRPPGAGNVHARGGARLLFSRRR